MNHYSIILVLVTRDIHFFNHKYNFLKYSLLKEMSYLC